MSTNPFELGEIYNTKRRVDPWDPDSKSCKAPHLQITGPTGTGKSTYIKELIDYLGNKRNKIVFVLDIHNDLEVANENYIKYTARNTKIGINPFEFDYDIENGGPEIYVGTLAQLFKKHFIKNLGIVQENLLKNLFLDTYKYKGILDKDPSTWPIDKNGDEITIPGKEHIELPNMSDLEDVYEMILNEIQSDFRSVRTQIRDELKYYQIKIKEAKNQRAIDKYRKLYDERFIDYENAKNDEDEDQQIPIDEDERYWITKYNIEITKYNDKKALRTLQQLGAYIKDLANNEIFNAKKPKFTKNINRIDLSGLTSTSKPEFAIFFIDLFMQRVFRRCKMKGEYNKRPPEQRRRGDKCDIVIVIDEARALLPAGKEKDNPYHIVNKISLEARKYGLALILGSQRIAHFSEDILTSMYTKIVLAVDPTERSTIIKRLGIKDKDLFESGIKHNDVIMVSRGGVMEMVKSDSLQKYVVKKKSEKNILEEINT